MFACGELRLCCRSFRSRPRTTKESEINLAVGLVLHKKVGDFVQKGEPLVTIHTDEENIAEVEQILAESIEISPEKVEKEPLIFDVIQ